MSFSKPMLDNPAKRFYEFKSDDKQFVYYDKEQQKKVPMELPAYVVVLDELSSISGFNEKFNCGIYSNEVKNVKSDILYVKSFKGDFAKEGLYHDIKGDVNSAGGKYTKSLYALLILRNEDNVIVNIKLNGAALNAWIDSKIDTQKNIVCINNKFNEGKKGKVIYHTPVLTAHDITDEIAKEAIEADKVLQEYFKSKFSVGENEAL